MTQRFFLDCRIIRYLGKFLSFLGAHRAHSPFRKVQDVSSLPLYHRRIPNRTFNGFFSIQGEGTLNSMLAVIIRFEFGKSGPQSYAEFSS